MLTPVELETELDKTLRGDQGAAQRIIDYGKALRQQLADATYRLNVCEPELTACRARADDAERQVDTFRLEMATLTTALADQCARKDALLADRSKDCKLAHANACMAGCKYVSLWQQLVEASRQLAQVTQERDDIITGGVTEELLRRHDGYLKVGRGCVIVREDELKDAKEELEKLDKLTAMQSGSFEMLHDQIVQANTTIESLEAQIQDMKEDRLVRIEAMQKLRDGYDASIAQLEAQIQAMKDERETQP